MYYDARIEVAAAGPFPPAPDAATQPILHSTLTVQGASLPPSGVAIRFRGATPADTADVELYALVEPRTAVGGVEPGAREWMLVGQGAAGSLVPLTIQDLSGGSYYLRATAATSDGALLPTFTI